jgi:hypothetical protein
MRAMGSAGGDDVRVTVRKSGREEEAEIDARPSLWHSPTSPPAKGVEDQLRQGTSAKCGHSPCYRYRTAAGWLASLPTLHSGHHNLREFFWGSTWDQAGVVVFDQYKYRQAGRGPLSPFGYLSALQHGRVRLSTELENPFF